MYNDARAFQRVYLQAVCEQMYYTLPREVRDMIYEHLHWEYDSTNPQAEIVRYAACIDDPSEPGGLGLGLSTDHSFPLSPNVPYWDETIVGPSVFFEIAQAWYRKVNLDPDLLVYGNLNDYLDRDRWDLGLRPADMMEHVSILVHPEHIVNPRYRKSLLGLMSLRPSCCVEFVLLDRLKRVQRCLGCHKVAIASNLRVSPPPFILSNLHAGLHVWDPLLPIAEKLKASGMRLSVSLKYCDLKLALYRHGCDDVLSIKQWRTVAKVAQQVSTTHMQYV